MASLIASYGCNRTPYTTENRNCMKLLSIFDIIGGIVLIIIGALIASGVLNLGVGAMCGIFTAGAFLLGAGLSNYNRIC